MKKRICFCCLVAFLLCCSMLLSFANVIEPRSTLLADAEVAAVSATSSTAITEGIKSFQNYINSNLPMTYLGTALAIDGRPGPATKTAIIKLIQYRLNQSGASLSVDGGFGTLTQAAFSQHVGTIKRYDSGPWVYILQGLLYCHGYNPSGFDGSYGVNGGTGCFNAVNNFKRDNAISEGADDSGIVGLQTMLRLVWRNETRLLPDGMFYLKNAYSQKYLNVQNGGTTTGTNVNQASKLTNNNNLRQLWKITYVGDGYYSLRPMHSINQSLALFVGSNVGLFDISLTDNFSTVDGGSRWKIVEASDGGYSIQWYGNSTRVLSLESNTTAENANVVVADSQGQDRARWILEKKNLGEASVRVFVDNSFSNYFGSSVATSARQFFNKAKIPFAEFMNYNLVGAVQKFPGSLTSDSCQHGYYNEVSSGTCCSPNSCNHNVNQGACCKCTYRIYNSISDYQASYSLKTCLFTFSSCYGGLGAVGGDTTVVNVARSADINSTAYMLSVRRIQHELTHNWGGRHQEEGDMCTSRCINNSGFDNVYDYELSTIWCNRCLSHMDINKF